jgi:hypothetical protein
MINRNVFKFPFRAKIRLVSSVTGADHFHKVRVVDIMESDIFSIKFEFLEPSNKGLVFSELSHRLIL